MPSDRGRDGTLVSGRTEHLFHLYYLLRHVHSRTVRARCQATSMRGTAKAKSKANSTRMSKEGCRVPWWGSPAIQRLQRPCLQQHTNRHSSGQSARIPEQKATECHRVIACLLKRTDKARVVHQARSHCSYLGSQHVLLDQRYATTRPVLNLASSGILRTTHAPPSENSKRWRYFCRASSI
jgi:hypothetical protein